VHEVERGIINSDAHTHTARALARTCTHIHTHTHTHGRARTHTQVQQHSRMVTLFSSSGYCGANNEACCILACEGKLRSQTHTQVRAHTRAGAHTHARAHTHTPISMNRKFRKIDLGPDAITLCFPPARPFSPPPPPLHPLPLNPPQLHECTQIYSSGTQSRRSCACCTSGKHAGAVTCPLLTSHTYITYIHHIHTSHTYITYLHHIHTYTILAMERTFTRMTTARVRVRLRLHECYVYVTCIITFTRMTPLRVLNHRVYVTNNK
jgi:hypothetical protein